MVTIEGATLALDSDPRTASERDGNIGMPKGLISELRQRNVFKVALGYLIACWLLAQVADLVLSSFDAPGWAMRALLIALAIGFPIALFISWAFEVTPEGVVPESQVDRTVKFSQESGRRLDFSILLILSTIIIFMGLDRFVFSDRGGGQPERPTAEMGPDTISLEIPPDAKPTAEKLYPAPFQKSVAVLPFTVTSSRADDVYFADGFTEEIINTLSQLPDLMVTARTSTFHFKGQKLPIGEIATQLGVDHIVEGSVRRAGDQLHITATLVRAADGLKLWSETYERRTDETYAVQDNIAINVAEALNIILDGAQLERMQNAAIRNVEASISFQKGIALHNQAQQGSDKIRLLRQANQSFEDAVSFYPTYSDAYIHHSDLYSHILFTTASGRLDGNINVADTEFAAGYLRADFSNAIRYANDDGQVKLELDRAVVLGEWQGIKILSERALLEPGCEAARWAPLVATPFGNAGLARNAFQHNITCDPLQISADIHLAVALLWLGDWAAAQQLAEQRLSFNQHPWLVRSLAIALAMQERFEKAETTIRQHTAKEDERLLSLAVLAAIQGADAASAGYAKQLTDGFGPDDLTAQRLAAQRGDRNEANRLASLIDRRPFGYLVLLQAVYDCACGAPFDLESTPVFASMLPGSGLNWPPVSPISFPLKDW